MSLSYPTLFKNKPENIHKLNNSDLLNFAELLENNWMTLRAPQKSILQHLGQYTNQKTSPQH